MSSGQQLPDCGSHNLRRSENTIQVKPSLVQSTPKLKPRWDVPLSGDDDQLGCAGESLSSVLGE